MMIEKENSSRSAIVFSRVLAISSAVLGIVLGMVGLAVSAFKEVFSSFGADLPAQTAWLVNFWYLLWMPLLLAIVLWWSVKLIKIRIWAYSVLVLIELVMLGMLPVMIYWLYLPIYKLGASV
jgi:hypothetical protein